MLNFSKSCHYALRAIMYLARNKDKPHIKIQEIAKKENLPLNFLSKIFQVLVKNGIVDSKLGPKGGVRLSLNCNRLSISDAIVALDGNMDLESCVLFGHSKCPEIKHCPIQNECKNSRLRMWDKLKKMRLNKL